MTRLADIGEFGLIQRLSDIFRADRRVVEGIGDDCAVVSLGDETLLVTCDLSIEDVHFRLADTRPEDIGWKTVAVSLSDIAAMGGHPKFVTVALAAPGTMDVETLERIATGMRDAATFGDALIVGGDTTKSDHGLIIDTMVIGEAPKGRYIPRNGAKNGDLLVVTGHPGDAAAGLHAQENGHPAPRLIQKLHRPVPRVAEGQWLARWPELHALIDISDGLDQDAGHLAAESELGVDIDPAALPLSDALEKYATEHALDPYYFVLHGGDAYELAMAMDSEAFDALASEFGQDFDLALTAVGTFSAEFEGLHIDGAPVASAGYDHFRAR